MVTKSWRLILFTFSAIKFLYDEGGGLAEWNSSGLMLLLMILDVNGRFTIWPITGLYSKADCFLRKALVYVFHKQAQGSRVFFSTLPLSEV